MAKDSLKKTTAKAADPAPEPTATTPAAPKAAKKTAEKKTAAKKTAAAAKKTTAKKPAAKKTTAKKPAAKKTTAKKAVAKTTAGKTVQKATGSSAAKATTKKATKQAAPKATTRRTAKTDSDASAGVPSGDAAKEKKMVNDKNSKKDQAVPAAPETVTESPAASPKGAPTARAAASSAPKPARQSASAEKVPIPNGEWADHAAKRESPGLVYTGADSGGATSDNLVMQVRVHQFEVEPKGEHHVTGEAAPPQGELPDGYDETTLILIPRDPEWAYAYWEISNHDRQRHQVNGDVVLRLYDVTDVEFTGHNAHSTFDIPVGGARNWYFRMPSSDRFWLAEIGRITSDGVFRAIARSNPALMPRNTVSPFGPDESEESWMTVESDFERIFELSGGKVAHPGGSSEAAPLYGKRGFLLPRIEMGSEALASGALYGGPISGAEALGRGFRLVVNTELIVYGATEPSATVTIQGHPVRLNPDGTFRIRLALPDGVQEIPVKAVREDGEEARVITPVITRETR